SARYARTTSLLNAWVTLVPQLGTIFPVAEATMSTVPHQDQTSAAQNSTAIVIAINGPSVGGGPPTISSATGRKASSSRRSWMRRNGTTVSALLTGRVLLAGFMEPSLQTVQRCIAAAGLDQRVVGAVLHQAAALERDDPVRRPHGREPVRNDKDRSSFGDLLHVLLDDALALIIERAGRLVEDQNARV